VTKSFRPEMMVKSQSIWLSNSFRFASYEEALAHADAMAARWTMVTQVRASPTEDAPNYSYHNGQLRRLVDIGYTGISPEDGDG
jgi:hypothetical protein